MNDIKKERNVNSNPSLFIKFLSINNLKNLSDKDLEDLVLLSTKRMN